MLLDRRGRFLRDALVDAENAYDRGRAATGKAPRLPEVAGQMRVIEGFLKLVDEEARRGPAASWRDRWRQWRQVRDCVTTMHRAANTIEILTDLHR